MVEITLPEYAEVAAAAGRIEGYANKTPVMTSGPSMRNLALTFSLNVKTYSVWEPLSFVGR